MCDCIELTAKLKDNVGTDSLALAVQPAYRLPHAEGTLWCVDEFPNYFVRNSGGCGCGAIDRCEDGPARLVPLRFVGYLLSIFPVESVALLWRWGDGSNKPRDLTRRRVPWSEFVRLNDERRLDSRMLYEILGKPKREAGG
jgi:hypothetical protein